MRTVPLSEISESIDYGLTASANDSPVGPKFLRITDIQNGEVLWDSVPYCYVDKKSIDSSTLRAGDIVFARTGATTGKSFLIKECPEDAVFASYLIRVRPNGAVFPSYLSHFFQTTSYWNQISLKSAGAAQPGVNSTRLKQLEIPLPPLEEQKRIAAILDQADALRRLRQRALDRLNTLGQSIFYEMFGDPLTTKHFSMEPLGACAKLINGRAYKKEEELDTGTPVLRIQNLNGGNKWFYSDLSLNPDKYCNNGDLLFAWSATFGPYIWWGEKAIYHYHIWKIECGPKIEKLYLYWLLKLISDDVKRGGRGISMTHATKAGMEKREIPVPPMANQKQFCDRMASLYEIKSIFILSCSLLEKNFRSLQQRAFAGEL